MRCNPASCNSVFVGTPLFRFPHRFVGKRRRSRTPSIVDQLLRDIDPDSPVGVKQARPHRLISLASCDPRPRQPGIAAAGSKQRSGLPARLERSRRALAKGRRLFYRASLSGLTRPRRRGSNKAARRNPALRLEAGGTPTASSTASSLLRHLRHRLHLRLGDRDAQHGGSQESESLSGARQVKEQFQSIA
jgi:hypothetical protein